MAAGDFGNAASNFRKATELNPKHTGAQLKLAQLMATSNQKDILEEAQKRTQGVLSLLPGDAEALNVLAITELRLGKPESAEAHLEQALKKSPTDLKSSVILAQTRLARKDTAGAEEALKQAVAKAPKSPEPSVYLGGFYLALGKTAEAEQQFRHALQIDPKHGPALLALGGMQVRAGQNEQAEQTYRQVSGLPDKQYRPIHALYLFQTGKRDQAIVEFEKLFKQDPADRNVRTDLVKAYLSLNRVGDAEKVLTAALKKNGLDVDALMQRSRIYLGSGKYTQAETDLNQILHFRNDSAEAHYLLAKVQQARGNTAMQKQEFGEALRVDPKYVAARIDLARALMAERGVQSALQLLDQAPAEQKGMLAVVAQRNWALLAGGQLAEARKGIDQILAAAKVPEALLQDAVWKLTQKDYAGARASVESVLSQTPADTRALRLLVQTYAAQKQAPLGLQKLREYAARQPGSAAVQQFFGQLLFASGDRTGARKAFETARTADPSLVAANLSLAELDIVEGKRADARNILSGILSAHPDNVAAHMFLAQVDLADGKPPAAIEQYRKVLELDGTNAGALNDLAYLLADANQSSEALKYAQQAKELAPENAAVDDTLGWTYYRMKMYPLAVKYLESATSKQPTAIRKYHLAMAYWNAGDANRGRQTLEAALKMDSSLPEAQIARQMFGEAAK